MIIQEHLNINGKNFIHTYSDEGRFILGGEPYGEYSDAYDPAEFNRTYLEGDLIPLEE